MTKALKTAKPEGSSAEKKPIAYKVLPGQVVGHEEKPSPIRRHRPATVVRRPKPTQDGSAAQNLGDLEETHILSLSTSDYLQLQSLIDDPPPLNEKTIRAIEAMRRKA